MDILTDTNVRLFVGLLASITLLALIIADALVAEYEMTAIHISLLTGIIWAFLGVDVLQRYASEDASADRSDDSHKDD